MIYADFNGYTTFLGDDDHGYLDLCGYGTIKCLSHHKIRLRDGLALKFYEPGDIEVEAVVLFVPEEVDQHNPHGKWFAKFPRDAVVDNKESSFAFPEHVCFKCRASLEDHLDQVGRQYKEICPHCNTPIMYPLLPPENS